MSNRSSQNDAITNIIGDNEFKIRKFPKDEMRLKKKKEKLMLRLLFKSPIAYFLGVRMRGISFPEIIFWGGISMGIGILIGAKFL